jgi:hypothetical protein
VGIAAVEGVTRAEEATGIPKQTIDYWTHKPEFGHLRTTARETVIESFWVGIQVGVDQVTSAMKDERTPVHQKAAALAVLADKYALLNGEATSRSEHTELPAPFDDEEKRALREAINGALDAQKAEP